MFLMIDNYDSFVYNLVRYFEELGSEVCIFRNDKITIDEIRELKPEGIIISPGPKDPESTGIALKLIEVFKGVIPILGICLGHQTIAYYFRGRVEKGEYPVHGKISTIKHDGKGVFNKLPGKFRVTRYHSLVVNENSLPECIEVTARTIEDNIVMGIRHKEFLIEGIQFHPEAELTDYGHDMLDNFIKEAKIFNRLVKSIEHNS
ncbi:MAG: aminodeoxychorismate/anthranilate synthase component II [Clostridium sp.]